MDSRVRGNDGQGFFARKSDFEIVLDMCRNSHEASLDWGAHHEYGTISI